MENNMLIAYLQRLIGYGAAAASGWAATKLGPDVAGYVGSGLALLGAVVLNKAGELVIPTRRKIEKLAKRKGIPMPGDTLRK